MTVSRSASASSVSIVSMSRIGSTRAFDVGDVAAIEAADDVQDRVHLADVREELVAQPFAGAAPRTMPAMSTTRTAAGMIFSVSENWLMIAQPLVRHRDDADVRLDRRKRIIRRQRPRGGQRVENGALADVGQPDNSDF